MSSSHEPAQPTVPSPAEPHVIRITRLSLMGVFMLLFGTLFPVSGWPAGLFWLLGLPLLALVWVLRTQTTLDTTEIRTRRVFGSRTVAWTQIKGVRFPRGKFARAVLLDDSAVVLPAVGYERLSELAAYSGGRIDDPYEIPQR